MYYRSLILNLVTGPYYSVCWISFSLRLLHRMCTKIKPASYLEQIWTASFILSRRLPLLRYSHCWLAVTVKIRIRYVIQLLVIEVLLARFFLNSDVGLGFVKVSPRCLKTARICQRRDKLRLRQYERSRFGVLLPESIVPDRLYFRVDRYSPAYPCSASGHPRYWFPAVQSKRYGQTGVFNAVSSLILGQSGELYRL